MQDLGPLIRPQYCRKVYWTKMVQKVKTTTLVKFWKRQFVHIIFVHIIFVPLTPPLPNQQSDGLPLEFLKKFSH